MFTGYASGEEKLAFRPSFVVDGIQIYPTSHSRCCTIFSDVSLFEREMLSKLPELRRETVHVSRETARHTDLANDLKAKDYADDKRRTVSRSLRVADAVPQKAEKRNKLSINFCPLKVVQKTDNEITL